MSLGIRAGSRLHGVLSLLTPYGAGKLKELAGHARAYAKHHRLDAAFRSRQSREGWRISFHPAAQDILLTIEDGHIVIDARTLEAGPGYHAFVAGLIDYLTRHHQWIWDLRSATHHFGDDTGYYRNRNFAALQTAMAGEFAAMCEGLVEAESGGQIPHTLWLPTEFCLAGDPFAATSLGFRDQAFFETPRPDRFFPWWEEGLTAQTVKAVALCKMWLEILWEPPTDAAERQDLENCRALIDRARALGAIFADDEGTGDIDTLLRGEPLDDTAAGIGYARQDTWYLEPGGWSIALPACYREEIGDDGQLCSLLHGDRAVYVRSYAFDEPRTQLDWPEPLPEGYDEYLRFKTDLYWVVVQSGEEVDEDGVCWWIWQGIYNAHMGSALISVSSADADDAAWAEKVLRSVRPDADVVAAAPARLQEP